jgi:hypothetical protein
MMWLSIGGFKRPKVNSDMRLGTRKSLEDAGSIEGEKSSFLYLGLQKTAHEKQSHYPTDRNN